jgi:hypothetical protein
MQPLSVCEGWHPFTGRVGKPQRPDGGLLQKPASAVVAYEIGKGHADLDVMGVGVDDDVPQTIADPAGVGLAAVVAGHGRGSGSASTSRVAIFPWQENK